MELNYEKDVLNLMKLLDYHLQSIIYNNPQFGDNPEEYIGTPWIEIELTAKELEDISLSPSKARLLKNGVCAKQGMDPRDFTKPLELPNSEEVDVEQLYREHIYGKTEVTIPVLFWIGSIINNIENNVEKNNKIKILKKNFNEDNLITLNVLNGEVTYNEVSARLSVGSRKYKILKALLESENNVVTYDELAKLLFTGADMYKAPSHREGLFDALGSLKEDLGILPKKDRKNLDCFENENKTYRLIEPR